VEAIRKLNILDRIGAIKLPTLVIVGEDDPGTPVAAAEAIHAGIAGSELVILPNASHFSNVEQADAFTGAMMNFLRSH
jgi:3-oxoadipate enol-lactonase